MKCRVILTEVLVDEHDEPEYRYVIKIVSELEKLENKEFYEFGSFDSYKEAEEYVLKNRCNSNFIIVENEKEIDAVSKEEAKGYEDRGYRFTGIAFDSMESAEKYLIKQKVELLKEGLNI